MRQTSEYVSLGHPDKVADFISEWILDRYLEVDPNTRYALEVQIKDNYATLAGEITSKALFTKEDRAQFAKDAVAAIGYTHEYALEWGDGNTLDATKLEVSEHISQQSLDIAQGVNVDGWGDQGIFWGMATPSKEHNYMPIDIWYARKLGKALYEYKVGGLDIKTQVAADNDNVIDVVVAVPLLPNNISAKLDEVSRIMHNIVPGDYKTTVNGTGSYVKHSSFADAGTTGRKLAVDFYGGNCRIGGGSPWTKDGTKADLALNLKARQIAIEKSKKYNTTVYVAMSCCIGKSEVDVVVLDSHNYQLEHWTQTMRPRDIVEELGLSKPMFANRCKEGLV